jgi:ABC-type transport system involved in multi-copper enzyme maturation permease subunit
VVPVGISRIEYRPWKGERTDPNKRLMVISKYVLNKNVRAVAVIVLLIVGMMLAHALPIIFALITPHEELTNEDMIGSIGGFEEGADPEYDFTVTDGNLTASGDIHIYGNFTIIGGFNYFGDLILEGSMEGSGVISVWQDDFGIVHTEQTGSILVSGFVDLTGRVELGTFPDLPPDFDPGDVPGDLPDDLFEGMALIVGNGTISGYGTIFGNGTVVGETEKEEDEFDMGGYLTSGIFIIFAMLLAAIVCADIVAQDLADSSFVMYFSRPVRTIDYLVGKFIGLSWVMGIFCLLPPIVYVLIMIGTQTGDDYSGSMKILGLTIVAGIVTSLYFLPYGLMLSSFTKNKAYAGIGIFMSFFVLRIISQLFSDSSAKWLLIDPLEVMFSFYRILFGGELAAGISSGEVAASMLAVTVIPAVITYIWVSRLGAGK